MKYRVNSIILMSVLFLFAGLSESQSSENASDMSADEFAELIGFNWWDIEVPALPADTHYGLCYEYEDGTIEPAAVMINTTPEASKKIRVYIRQHHAMRDCFEVYFLKDGLAQPFMIKNSFLGFSPMKAGETVSLGSPLISSLTIVENESTPKKDHPIPSALVFKTHIKIN